MAQHNTAQKGDADEWIERVKGFVNNPKTVTDAAPAHYSTWHNSFFGCLTPVDTCLITCCCPCITFGKTHHRLRKDPTLKDYSVVNASCLGFWATAWCGVWCIPLMLQRHDIRSKFSLQGEGVGDFLRACCCHCCDLIQQDKEAEYQLLHGQNQSVVAQQPMAQGGMTYGGADTTAAPAPVPEVNATAPPPEQKV